MYEVMVTMVVVMVMVLIVVVEVVVQGMMVVRQTWVLKEERLGVPTWLPSHWEGSLEVTFRNSGLSSNQ